MSGGEGGAEGETLYTGDREIKEELRLSETDTLELNDGTLKPVFVLLYHLYYYLQYKI